MIPVYECGNREVWGEYKNAVHVPPHLHEAAELVYVTEGALTLGVGRELYPMKQGDFAVVFPNIIHHYQVFDNGENRAMFVLVDSSWAGGYETDIQRYCPVAPVIAEKQVHEDIVRVMKTLVSREENSSMLTQAYVQILFAHIFSEMKMMEKGLLGGSDIVYNSVEYVARNFREEITLEKMACELGIGKYALSRMFAKTFHCNFRKYVNGVRVRHAAVLLESTDEPVTNLCLECGFDSQRTFNRVFKEQYKMTPKEYRIRGKQYIEVEGYL